VPIDMYYIQEVQRIHVVQTDVNILCGFAFKGTMLDMVDELDSDLTECPCIAVRGPVH
jgi:hypothetical protein